MRACWGWFVIVEQVFKTELWQCRHVIEVLRTWDELWAKNLASRYFPSYALSVLAFCFLCMSIPTESSKDLPVHFPAFFFGPKHLNCKRYDPDISLAALSCSQEPRNWRNSWRNQREQMIKLSYTKSGLHAQNLFCSDKSVPNPCMLIDYTLALFCTHCRLLSKSAV